MAHENFGVVLVNPKESLNIGSVARAMKNLGFSSLSLVNPLEYRPERVAITACAASDLIDSIQIRNSLEEALRGYSDVIGFSGRAGKNRPGQLSLPELPTEIGAGKTALVFGPEDNGLSREDAALCRLLVRIPSAEECSSYNLAQAVLLVLAELSRSVELESKIPDDDLPSDNEIFQLDRIFRQVAEKCGFYREGTPEPVPYLVQNLLRRMKPDKREMAILLGLFSKVDRHIDYLSKASPKLAGNE